MHILMVDDDPFVRDVAVTVLSAVRGVKIEARGSGAEAVAALDGFTPDLVVLDLLMPVMDGRATWTALTAAIDARRGPIPRVIFLTARDDPEMRRELTALGAAGVIVKPFDPRTLATEMLAYADPGVLRTARLAAVAQDFARSLPATMEVIDQAWGALAAGWQAQAAEKLLAEAHRIAGVAAMFQFPGLGEAADKVEGLLRAALAINGWGEEQAKIEGAVRALMEEGKAANA